MLINRFFFLCITVCLVLLGCGGPSATEIYELEQRISTNEKNRADAESSLNSIEGKANQVTQQLAQVQSAEQALDQRLDSFETTLADIKNQLNAIKDAQPDTSNEIELAKLVKLESRIVELEKSTSVRDTSPDPENLTLKTKDTDASDKVKMSDSSVNEKKASRKTGKNRKSSGFEVTLFSWNVESEGNDPQVIAKQLADLNRYDVYGLSEVLPESIELYTNAIGEGYESIASRSGRNDRLQIIYNTKKYRLVRRLELDDINFQYRYRSPLVAHLEDRATGQQFLVMNNHLARGRAEVREKQAEQLVEWARNQNIPIIAIGDYNFDYVFNTRKGNEGFVAMMRDNIWQWVKPVEFIDTNWYDNPRNPDGKPDYPGSMLDFAFVAGAATEWDSECRIIVRPGDFPDNDSTSDHRPFELKISTR